MKRILIVFSLLLLASVAFSQKTAPFSSQSEAFIQDLGKYIKDSKNDVAKKEFSFFEQFWVTSRLSESNQKRFVEISNRLVKKKYRANPHFTQLMKATRFAVDSQMVENAVMDTLMLTIARVAKEYKRPQYEYFFKTIIPFLERNTLNNGKYNDILAQGAFKIVWREQSKVVEESEPNVEDKKVITADDAWDGQEENGDDEDDWASWDDWDESANEESWDSQDAWGDEAFDETKDDREEQTIEKSVVIGYISPELPLMSGPVIEFEEVDFGFVSKYDSVAIKGSKGTFVINERKVVADGGTFDWSSTGLSKEVKGTFKTFVFPTNKIHVEAEGFTLSYDNKIEAPVEGIFEFMSVKHSRPENAKFPRFMSYNNDVKLKDLGEDIEYIGGFSLDGRNVYSSCVSLAKSIIKVSKGGIKKFEAHAFYFEMGDSIVRSNPTSITIYFGKDSIYHPSVELKYNRSTENLSVYKHESKYEDAPYVDTYHNMDIHVDKISWTLSDSVINMDVMRGKKTITASFTSKDYFSERDYVYLKGLYPFHPLQLLVSYAEKKSKTKFYLDKIVKYSHQTEAALNHAMIDMMHIGLIEYESNSGLIKLLPKAQYYVDSRKRKVDYDVISIQSINPGGHTAILDLSDSSLEINGVDSVYFSDSLDVNFHPNERKMKVLQNRTLVFDGMVNTSIYNFNGREFTFNYDFFNIDLVHIDSIKFQIDTEDSITGRKTGERQIDNKLTYSSGTLYIDSAINKSSQQTFPKFPYFDANRGAYVFFNQKDILGGAYDTTFHFKIPPFDSDSMSSSSGKSVSFDGTFVSAGIFPSFEHTLIVMEDFSFGFDYVIPEEGYQLYNGDGVFHGSIRLDKNGLRGVGYIDYLNTHIESEDFVFYIDSVVAVGQNCFTKGGVNEKLDQEITFAPVDVANFEMRWYPKNDTMLVTNLIDPFSFYDSTAFLDGTINITHDGLEGGGIFNKKGSRTISKEFHFQETRFDAREGEFEILSDVKGKPAVRSDYVHVYFELDSGFARFSPEEKGVASNEFPYLQYKTSVDDGRWDFETHTVTMSIPEGSDVNDSYFYSTHPDQDSLVFHARKAVYLMDSLSLHVTGVPEILVGDGRVLPDGNELYIKENAFIVPLQNAEIILDTVGEFHHLVEGTIQIETKNRLTGKANYAYKNLLGDTLFIEFNQFDLVDVTIDKKHTEQHTFAQGIVPIEDSFLLAPKLYYQGSASMYANKKMLTLDGAIKLDLDGEIKSPNWLNYTKVDDVDSIVLSTKGQKTASGLPVLTGVHYSKARNDYYVTMLSEKGGPKDFSIFRSDGIIFFDYKNNEFLIGDSLRLYHEHYEGNLFAYEPSLERVRIQGLIDVFGHPNQEDIAVHPELDVDHPVEVQISAEGDMYLLDHKFEINGLSFITFDYNKKALDAMGNDMAQMSRMFLAPPAYHFNDTIAFEIADIAGEKAAITLKQNPSLPLPKIAKMFLEGIVLTDVHLEWNKEQKAWYSKDSLGIGSIGAHQINAMVNGFLEIKKGKGFDYTVNLYLELNERVWYYFSFEKNRLLTGGANQTYNDLVASKNTRSKYEPTGGYFYDVAPASMKKKFLNRFARTYLSGEGLEEEVMDLELDFEALEADSLSSLDLDEGDEFIDSEEEFFEDDEITDEDEMFDDTEEQIQDLEDEIFQEMKDEVDDDFSDEEDSILDDDFEEDSESLEDGSIEDKEDEDDDEAFWGEEDDSVETEKVGGDFEEDSGTLQEESTEDIAEEDDEAFWGDDDFSDEDEMLDNTFEDDEDGF